MPRSSSLAGVILAAGASLRMGQDKALLQYAGRSFLAGAIQLLQSVCDFVVVVAGKNFDVLGPVVYENSGYLVLNPQPDLGQFSSLRLGLQAVLNRGRDAACVTLVDRPPAELKTVQKLNAYFLLSSPETTWAVVPQFDGKHGHPVILAREMIEAFLRANPSSNAREIEHQHQDRIEYLDVDDPRVVLNINTPEDYSSLQAAR
ncbi:MAG TPA: nucleotidyltransferase family protein [Terriglobales bacterium]|jgi:molybdenum cofactor cytidylyltransferase|nr:nucleotidyltransferase family protein [Terriglobales bacterium]